MSTVIICADDSKHSDYALEFYLQHVHRPENKVRVVHCPENWKNIGPMEGPTPGRLMELQQEAKQTTSRISDKCQEAMQKAGVAGEFVQLDGRDPWDEIVKEATKSHATLIVIGTRGMSSFRRTLLGSCSDSVLHHAHCPVLICRHKDDKH